MLVTGGRDSSGNPTASAEVYDPGDDEWSPAMDMGTARAQHAATLLGDGRVLVHGGTTGSEPTVSAELYDPVGDSWSPAADMETKRVVHTATRLPDGGCWSPVASPPAAW